ncbi:hypothetical protein B0H14DRAFT_1347577 [Mycena olivaceomarginata]|nr:hypothetical protein B0H14DRAFT_1347577 [Mycena olivaceomarginata]
MRTCHCCLPSPPRQYAGSKGARCPAASHRLPGFVERSELVVSLLSQPLNEIFYGTRGRRTARRVTTRDRYHILVASQHSRRPWEFKRATRRCYRLELSPHRPLSPNPIPLLRRIGFKVFLPKSPCSRPKIHSKVAGSHWSTALTLNDCPGNTQNSNSSSAIGALAKVRRFLVFNLWLLVASRTDLALFPPRNQNIRTSDLAPRWLGDSHH